MRNALRNCPRVDQDQGRREQTWPHERQFDWDVAAAGFEKDGLDDARVGAMLMPMSAPLACDVQRKLRYSSFWLGRKDRNFRVNLKMPTFVAFPDAPLQLS